ncbi:glycosyltransferase family 4 protein [Maridesulfovibrio sp.]|uniref:glycosyltransferase family 4 protein n=1 Tax=Maridesulfovibrio sp. TaxID=2795000 RepID=UPI003BAAFF66
MKCAFLIDSFQKSGGLLVVLRHAVYLQELGNYVVLICDTSPSKDFYNWFPKAESLEVLSTKSCEGEEFDIAIATWWETAFNLPKVKARTYAYFSQLVESLLYPESQILKKLMADASYCLPVHMIVEATWIQRHLKQQYGRDASLVLNGLDNDIFYPEVSPIAPPVSGVRVLIEGDIYAQHKNVQEALDIARQSNAQEVWLLTLADISDHSIADRVFSNVSAKEVASIYSACDILLKTSLVEGMFGPPLEMFGCGGTAVVYKVEGAEEYIVNGKNGIVIDTNDKVGALNSLNMLIADSALLARMKEEAIITASEWPSWAESSSKFAEVVTQLSDHAAAPYAQLAASCRHFLEMQQAAETFQWNVCGLSLKRIAKFFDQNPKIYRAISPLWSWLR